MDTQKNVRVLIAASGTGGHLFPGLFIARAFERAVPEVVVEFIGSGRALEDKIIGSEGYKIHKIAAVGIKHRGLKGFIQACFFTPLAIFQLIKLFINFRPQIVIGVGGYVTFLPISIAFIFRIPTWIHEAEIEPGMANKILSKYATRISLAFPEGPLYGKKNVEYTGHPVRESIKEVTPGITNNEQPRRILILGGSQGARALDEIMQKLSPDLSSYQLEIFHQSRPENVQRLEKAYLNSGIKARVASFIEDMAAAYSWSDIIIARSGAGTLMEISVVNRPALFVPYPNAQGDHQTANALTLVKAGKALLAKEGENFETEFKAALLNLLDQSTYHSIKNRAYQARSREAADTIVKGCLNLIG